MKKMAMFIIIAVMAILLIGGYFLLNKKDMTEVITLPGGVVEIKDFSCSGMDGFTFKYPVFKGWEVRNVSKQNDDRCIVVFKWPNKDIYPEESPSLTVYKEKRLGFNYIRSSGINFTMVDRKNNDGIQYDVINGSDGPDIVEFYGEEFGVRLELSVFETLGDGFDKDLFFRTVIDSFKFNK